MDLKKISQEEHHFDDPVEVPLFAGGQPRKNSKGEPVAVTIVGEYSKPARRVASLQKSAVAKLVRRYGSWEAIPQAEHDALADERTAACIVGFKGFESDGQPYSYSSDNAIALVTALRLHEPADLKQIEGAIQAHADFFAKRSAA